MIRTGYGEAYCKDNKNQSMEDVIKIGIDKFYVKHPDDKIDFIECSMKDFTDVFMFMDFTVKPHKAIGSGTIWIKAVDLV